MFIKLRFLDVSTSPIKGGKLHGPRIPGMEIRSGLPIIERSH